MRIKVTASNIADIQKYLGKVEKKGKILGFIPDNTIEYVITNLNVTYYDHIEGGLCSGMANRDFLEKLLFYYDFDDRRKDYLKMVCQFEAFNKLKQNSCQKK